VWSSLVIAAVTVVVYHFAVALPRHARTVRRVGALDALAGGDGGATGAGRLEAVEQQLARLSAAQERIAERTSELERIARADVLRAGFVRYNAFTDSVAELSFALALVNAEGDGVLLNSVFSREETRMFGKHLRAFRTEHEASKEELSAIESARAHLG
jgi:hypothetical protein